MLRGSCLCGDIRFEVTEPIHPIGMCHCSLCRKVSGVASNATFMIGKDDLTWLSGQDRLETYALPSGWHTTFCPVCGSPAPNLHPSGGAYWVPAGTLDDAAGVAVAMHIFVGSKASWDEIAGSAPQYDEGFTPGE